MAAATGARTAAAATAVQPSLARPELASTKAIGLLCLASLWVACAAAGAAAVMLAATDYETSRAFHALVAISIRAVLSAVLLGLVAPLLFLRALLCDAAFREEIIRHGQASSSRASAGCLMYQTQVRMFLAVLAFVLLSAIGSLLLIGLSPAKGSRMGRICAMLVVVGIVGSTVIFCFFSLPLMAWNLWRTKTAGVAVAGSNV
ncbi:hypothetical protein BS78_07G136100 [Paspalum vaginatum]|nr:hypothetical protein BS78_07G136100 [Paspalum vaginatum]KAJ1268448.1 hypothetical protein BS78_07G136100 [Paspalum vaginatum]